MQKTVKIGIIQTNLDASKCWPPHCGGRMNSVEASKAARQILAGIRSLLTDDIRPDIILIPELSVPRYLVEDLADLACDLDCILIAGCDYRIDKSSTKSLARNQAMLVIPLLWKSANGATSRKRRILWMGKQYPAPSEDRDLKREGCTFQGEPRLPLLDLADFGLYGVAICYDMSDLRRAWAYRGRIDHLLVIAYNRDLVSFRAFADVFARTIYCGVVICNTGFYGGTYCVMPYQKSHQRVIYSRDGANLLSAQTVELPVEEWRKVREGKRCMRKIPASEEHVYKAYMAGYLYNSTPSDSIDENS